MNPKSNYMADDDLEYHINFPIPEPLEHTDLDFNKLDHSDNNSKKDETNSQQAQELDISCKERTHTSHQEKTLEIHRQRFRTEPVVFLLGWFNAQDRHLAKYSSLYNQLGCITVRYTAPSNDIFGLNHVNLKLIAKKLLKLLEETTLSKHPVIFHNFSNHGSILYSHISTQMETSQELPLEVVGCIFDSTPSPVRIGSIVKAVYRTTSGSILRRLLTCTVLCIGLCVWKALSVLSTLVTGRLPNNPPWCLLQESFRWPQLFLYSKIDDLIPYEDVELFASERQSLGVQVALHEFIDSPHVMHYKVHPQEYRKVVNDFVKVCLENRSPIPTKGTDD